MKNFILFLLLLGTQWVKGAEERKSPATIAIDSFGRNLAFFSLPAATGAKASENHLGAFIESYMVVISPDSEKKRIVARFDFAYVGSRLVGWRTVTTDEVAYPSQELAAEETDRYLKKFREFDWSANPKKAEPGLCGFFPPPRMAFKAITESTYREMEAPAYEIPAYVEFLGYISPIKK